MIDLTIDNIAESLPKNGRVLIHRVNDKTIAIEQLSDDMYVMTFLAFYEAIERLEKQNNV